MIKSKRLLAILAVIFLITACAGGGESGSGSNGNNGVVIVIPNAPSGLTAVAVSNSRINLAWTDNSENETGFKIERRTGTSPSPAWSQADGAFTQIAVVDAGATSFQDSGLAGSTSYEYRVRAYNSVGDSGYSNTAGDQTGADNEYWIAGTWLIDTGQAGNSRYIGMQVNSNNILVDLIGLFNINHPTSGTASVNSVGAFTVNSGDLGGGKKIDLAGQLDITSTSGTGVMTYTNEYGNPHDYDMSMLLQPAISPLHGTWNGNIHEGQDSYPVTIVVDGQGVATLSMFDTAFGQGNSASDGVNAVIFIYNSNNDQLKLQGTLAGKNFNGTCSSELHSISAHPDSFALSK